MILRPGGSGQDDGPLTVGQFRCGRSQTGSPSENGLHSRSGLMDRLLDAPSRRLGPYAPRASPARSFQVGIDGLWSLGVRRREPRKASVGRQTLITFWPFPSADRKTTRKYPETRTVRWSGWSAAEVRSRLFQSRVMKADIAEDDEVGTRFVCQTDGKTGPGLPNAFGSLNSLGLEARMPRILGQESKSLANPFGVLIRKVRESPFEATGGLISHQRFFLRALSRRLIKASILGDSATRPEAMSPAASFSAACQEADQK